MCLQVLETGIAFHSVLIGIALGVSNSPCTIRPLLAALTFHQFFEGVALGSCLLQVSFTSLLRITPVSLHDLCACSALSKGSGISLEQSCENLDSCESLDTVTPWRIKEHRHHSHQ